MPDDVKLLDGAARYLEQLMRASLGQSSALLGKAANPTSLVHLANQLAEGEQAKATLRGKGYGLTFSSCPELAALVPDAPVRAGAGGQR